MKQMENRKSLLSKRFPKRSDYHTTLKHSDEKVQSNTGTLTIHNMKH